MNVPCTRFTVIRAYAPDARDRPTAVPKTARFGAAKLSLKDEHLADGSAHRGRGTPPACRCMNSSEQIAGRVVPSRQGVFIFSATYPAALHRTRSLVSAGRLM